MMIVIIMEDSVYVQNKIGVDIYKICVVFVSHTDFFVFVFVW